MPATWWRTDIPSSLTEAQQEQVRHVIKESFARTFAILMYIGAAACVFTAAVAALAIDDKELKFRKGEDIEHDSSPQPADDADQASSA